MFAVLVHRGWSLIVRIGVVIYCENFLLKVVIRLENLQFKQKTSYEDIGLALGVSKGTAFNYVWDYPYRK
jgi:hypothetical protein